MNEEDRFYFEVILHLMEFFVVVGIASSVYFVRRSRKKNYESKNIK